MCPRFTADMQQSRRASGTVIKALLPVSRSLMSVQLMTFSHRPPGLLATWLGVIGDVARPIRD